MGDFGVKIGDGMLEDITKALAARTGKSAAKAKLAELTEEETQAALAKSLTESKAARAAAREEREVAALEREAAGGNLAAKVALSVRAAFKKAGA